MPYFGGDEGDRTPYLLNAIQALSRTKRKRTPGFKADYHSTLGCKTPTVPEYLRGGFPYNLSTH